MPLLLEADRRVAARLAALLVAAGLGGPMYGQVSQPQAQQAVESAVQSELHANDVDKSIWAYRDRDVSEGKDSLYLAVETREGQLRRLVEENGRPVVGEARANEDKRIADYVNDPSAQARQRKAGAHDDAQAAAMLRMLPQAFTWTVVSQTPEFLTLAYKPNPKFDPPDTQARVMGLMAGEMMIARNGNRIRTLKGNLTEDVKFGFGIFGRLNQGGSFDIERREVAPGHWQITESHVHIGGKALLFKTIGQQDDETKTDWKPSPAQTLQQAEKALREVK